MDAPNNQKKSDPAILLLNEIDILLAQTRLMDLYLKQAQATAANENARIHEQYESELATLRTDLADRERQLQERPINLSGTIDQLQRELSEKHQILSSQEVTFQRSRSEIAALQGRIAQLEADNSAAVNAARGSNAVREILAADVAALNQELERSRRELDQQQITARELESGLREQLQLLQKQVAEKQNYAVSANDQLGKAQQEVAALQRQLGTLQALHDELRSSAARELEHARGRFETELASLRSALGESDRTALQSKTVLLEIERGLKSEIGTLRNELDQRLAALGLRDESLRAAGAQIAALQQRIADLESAHRQATDATAEMDNLRRSLSEEVAQLQHEVEVKEKELTHRYEAVTAVELALHGRLQALQQELARAHEASDLQEVELQNHRAETAALQGRLAELERAQAGSNSIESARQQLETELNRLRADLAHKESLLAERERFIGDLEARWAAESATLHQQLDQERSSAARTYDELLQARGELAAGREQLEAQLSHKDAEISSLRASAIGQSEQLSQQINNLQQGLAERETRVANLEARLTVELATLQEQLAQERSSVARTHDELLQARGEFAASREQLEAQLSHKDHEIGTLRASATGQSEQLSQQIDDLQRQLAERASGVANLEVEIAALHQQLERERSSGARTNEELLQARNEFTASREQLEAQLSHKDAELSNLSAKTAGQSEQLSQQINDLQRQLAERASGVANLEVEIAALHQQLEQERSSAARTNEDLLQARNEFATSREQLEAQLSHKDDEIGNLRASANGQTEQLSQQVSHLQQQLAEREDSVVHLETRLGSEIAALQEQLTQERGSAARIRDELFQARNEFAAIREQLEGQLSHKDAEISNLNAHATGQSEQLLQQINHLQQQLGERERNFADLESRLSAEVTALREQLAQERNTTATANDDLARFQAELATSRERLDVQLKQKDDEFASLRAHAARQIEQLSNRIDELQLQLAEKQLLAESRISEIDRLKTSVTQLTDQLSEEATNYSQARGLWQDSQAQHSSDIAQLTTARDELVCSQTALEVELDQARSTNAEVRGELQQAINRIGELDALLKSSQTAMAVVATERDRLFSELETLHTLHNQTKADAARDLVQGRDALESELTALRNELQQKAWSVAQHQANVENLAQIHREQMRKLEARLNEQYPVIEQRSRELEQTLARANALQLQVEDLRAALQQTQAAGAGQAERIRQEYAARLEIVNSLLAIKSAEMANSGAVRANVEESLRGELTQLRSEIESRTTALQSREDELDRVRAEMTSVQNRLAQLESVSARTESEAREISQVKSGLENELTALRGELQQGSSAVAQQQAAMDELAARHRTQVEQLEANLNEHQRAGEERRQETDQAQAQISLLQSRIEELQNALQQSELAAKNRTEELGQEYAARIDALNRELGEHSGQLHDRASAISHSEQALRSEIDRLIGEAQERNQILEDRNDELVRVKNDLDALSERFRQLESHSVNAENSAIGDAESMRSDFQARLALLQAELSQKEWAVEERQAIIAGLEQEHRQQLEALLQQLAEKEQAVVPAGDGFVMGNPNLTGAHREKLHGFDALVVAGRTPDDASLTAPFGRRWRSGFGWKRRWRS